MNADSREVRDRVPVDGHTLKWRYSRRHFAGPLMMKLTIDKRPPKKKDACHDNGHNRLPEP